MNPADLLRFDRPLPPDGYAWWYADALSDDGRHGLTVIAFLGSVFSPWYALARRRGPADPLDHAALNLSLYGAPRRWAMTERGRRAVSRSADHLALGPSRVAWEGDALVFRVDEVTAPLPSRLRGTVRIIPEAWNGGSFDLDAEGRHRWTPLAPVARAEVEMERPSLRWSGPAYLDSNEGAAPLERDFLSWHWCRAPGRDGTAIVYEAERRDRGRTTLSLLARPSGMVETAEPPPPAPLPPSRLWRLPRATRAEGGEARVLRALEDAPFYARSVIAGRWRGEDRSAVHEALSLERFRSPLVQAMLPFRAPRALASRPAAAPTAP